MYQVQREYLFCAAHRLEDHEKCSRLHGHNYVVQVSVSSIALVNGMVVDFHELDRIVKPVVDELDHKYIVSQENIYRRCPYVNAAHLHGHAVVIDIPNSTAEYLSEWLANEIAVAFKIQGYQVRIDVTLQETPKSVARFTT